MRAGRFFIQDWNVPRKLHAVGDIQFDVERELLRKNRKDVEEANLDLETECHKIREISQQKNNRTPAEEELFSRQFEAFALQNHIISVWMRYVMGSDGHFFNMLRYIELLAQEARQMGWRSDKAFSRVESSILEQKELILEQKKIDTRAKKNDARTAKYDSQARKDDFYNWNETWFNTLIQS